MKLSVDQMFEKKGAVVPFSPGRPCDTIEELLQCFDKPEELFVVEYAPGNQAIGHIRDKEWIELKRRLTDKYIGQTGKKYGELTMQDALWVNQQVERELTEMN